MRITGFSSFVEQFELQPLLLRDAALVVEGAAFFRRSYGASQLSHALGCESHLYARYIRNHLAMFKKANVRCYFIFKGGSYQLQDALQRAEKEDKKKKTEDTVCPIFMREIYMEILEEMGFDYVVCEYESKTDVRALAQKLECPIVGNDIEFCFSRCQYIPCLEMKFNDEENAIECRYFHLETFLKKYNLNEEKISIFIVLMDLQCFPHGHFTRYFKNINVPLNGYQRIGALLKRLSQGTHQQTLKLITRFLSKDDYNNFYALKTKMLLMIQRTESGGVATAWLTLRRGPSAAGPGNWLAAGVAGGHVAPDYVNLYRHKHFFGSQIIKAGGCFEDAMFLSMDIVKYAFDLLTDYRYDGFEFVCDTNTESGRDTMTIGDAHSTRRPEYEANVCVFENGWSEVRELGLFEHFLQESLQRAELGGLRAAPPGAQLLLAALLYFARRKRTRTRAEAAAVLLSYVMLSHVFVKMDKDKLPQSPFYNKPIESPTTDEDYLTEVDCNTAAAIMEDYVTTSDTEVSEIYDEELAYPLVEFQHCLCQLSDLNALCGGALPRPALRGACAGPLVYKLRRAMAGAAPRAFLNTLLSPAPTVLAFLNGLIDVYENMLNE